MADQFLHEREDFKPLVDRVAQENKIETPALVEKDYWLMHCLYGLSANDLKFQLKGGTSLSKGFGIIHRFSEDIDIRIEPFDDVPLYAGPNHEKDKHIESRKNFFERLKGRIKIPGIVKVERDTEDDDQLLRNAGLRLYYDSKYDHAEGLKEGILLEVGFDQTSPHQKVNISSWVVDFADLKKMTFKDNRALEIPCYNPEYTFVEKLQAVTKKFKQFQDTGNMSRNFLRHYYDIYQLLDVPAVKKFIGTDDYFNHKKKRFKSLDQNIAQSEAFKLTKGEIRTQFEAEYIKTRSLYYREQISLGDILKRIAEDLLSASEMDQDKQHFRDFLKLCQQNGITVWADSHLMATKNTTGHWNGVDHISVYRPNQKIELVGILPIHSTDEKITAFIDNSPNIKWEMAVLLHEYGHWLSKHPHLASVEPNTAYQHEVEAWDRGEEVGRSLGISDFSIFYADRDKSLLGYREGLKLVSLARPGA